MSCYLIVSLTPPLRNGRDPLWWVDIGHVEIMSWAPPNPPEAHALTVEPTTHWRMFLSMFWPQRARVIRIRGFPGRASYWKVWTVLPAEANAVTAYLEELRLRCRKGEVRYRLLSFNCFHVAYRCLGIGGVELQNGLEQRRFLAPALWARSFRNALMSGVERRRMDDHFGHGRGQAERESQIVA